MNLPQASRSIEHFFHATAQAPWRAQRQWIGALLVMVLGLGMTAALYLDVTSQAAITGRQIQALRLDLSANQQANGDMKSKLAELTSASAMEARALQLGYEQIDPSALIYVQVPGYAPPQPVILAGASSLRPNAASMPPEYSESLIAWLGRQIDRSMRLARGGAR